MKKRKEKQTELGGKSGQTFKTVLLLLLISIILSSCIRPYDEYKEESFTKVEPKDGKMQTTNINQWTMTWKHDK